MTASHLGKCISGNTIKNNGTTILQGGNVTTTGRLPNVTSSLTPQTNAYHPSYGAHVFLAVSPTSSGNVGTTKILSTGYFAQMKRGQYIVRGLPTNLAQITTTNNALVSGASDFGVRRPIARLETTRTNNITAWDYATGVPTYGGSRGASESFGNDNAARPTMAVPGKLVFFTGKPVPTATAYAAKTST